MLHYKVAQATDDAALMDFTPLWTAAFGDDAATVRELCRSDGSNLIALLYSSDVGGGSETVNNIGSGENVGGGGETVNNIGSGENVGETETVGGIAAAGCLIMPCEFFGNKNGRAASKSFGHYYYAMTVREDMRSRGLFRELCSRTLAYSREHGADFALLIPSREEYFGMYNSLGFTHPANGFTRIKGGEVTATVCDGLKLSDGITSSDGTTSSGGLTLSGGTASNGGITLSDGTASSDGITLSDGTTSNDGITLSDGTASSDGTTSSDSITLQKAGADMLYRMRTQSDTPRFSLPPALTETALRECGGYVYSIMREGIAVGYVVSQGNISTPSIKIYDYCIYSGSENYIIDVAPDAASNAAPEKKALYAAFDERTVPETTPAADIFFEG